MANLKKKVPLYCVAVHGVCRGMVRRIRAWYAL